MTDQVTDYEAEIARLKKINAALITRIEAGAVGGAAYDSFAHSVFLADQVRERTAALNDAMVQLSQSNLELEQARGEAEAARASQTRLLTAISHDIMQPVCAAQLLVANLQDFMVDKPKQVGAIAQAVADIEYLLQSLLDYSRQGKEQKAELQAHAVDDVLASLAIESFSQAQAKGLDFVYRPTKVWASTDGNILLRILRNLISNALRYTQAGEVALTVRAIAEQVIITVKDTGCGFEENYSGELLEPFKKAANNSNNEGLGLGLSNVASLCKLLGCELTYRSKVGKGTEFSITLSRCHPRRATKTVTLTNGAVPFPYTVLVIDNSASVRQALGILLDSWGATSHCFASLAEVPVEELALMDVAIMDYHLDNQQTGLQALQQHALPCPAVFITASNEEADLQAISAANYPIVKKPIRPPRLRRTLEKALAD